MAECKYFFRGNEFNSSIELDLFLLTKHKYYKTQGDAVFQYSERKARTIDILSKIREDIKSLKKMHQESKRIYLEDGEESRDYKRPYTGVNSFLKGLEVNNKRLFPEFIEDEYWSRKKVKWAKGEFDEDEIKLFFEGDKGNIKPIKDDNLFLLKKDQVKRRWKKQGITGSFMHKVFEIYIQGSKLNSNISLDPKDILQELEKWYQIEYKNPNKDVDDGNFDEYIDELKVIELLNNAKKLKLELENKLGKGLTFYTEFAIQGKATREVEGKGDTLLGYIDLLVIDKNGIPHIIDYKASVKPFVEFNKAKELTFKYQLATYHRLLSMYGINTEKSKLIIAPFQMTDFKVDDNGILNYSGIKLASSEILIDYTDEIFDPSKPYQEKLDDFLPSPLEEDLSADEVLVKTILFMKSINPEYNGGSNVNLEEIVEELKLDGAFLKKDDKYYYTPPYSNMEPIEADSEDELAKKIYEMRKRAIKRDHLTYDKVIKALELGMKDNTLNVEFPNTFNSSNPEASSTWFKDKMGKYLNDNYKVIESPIFRAFGMIVIKNKINDQIDIIKLSNKNLNYISHKTFKDTGLQRSLGISDAQENSKPNSLMLKAANGNIDMMEALTVINSMPGLFKKGVLGSVSVANAIYNRGITASNEELLYSWNKFAERQNDFVNNFKNGDIHAVSKFELLSNTFEEIIYNDKFENQKYSKISKIRDLKDSIDNAINSNIEDKIKALEMLRLKLEEEFKQETDATVSDHAKIFENIRVLYNQTLLAISDLKGVTFRLQLENSKMLAQKINIFSNGLSGTYIDNPGQLNSDTLNVATKQLTQAYQNIRTELNRYRPDVVKHVEQLKQEKSYTLAEDYIIGNTSRIYENLYEDPEKYGGDLVFKSINDPSLTTAEREILKFALESINNNRKSGLTSDIHSKKQKSHDLEYHRVPIIVGDSEAEFNEKGLFNMLKDKLSFLHPKKFFERTLKKLQGAFTDPYEEDGYEDLFKMTDHFAKTEGPDRLELLNKMREKGYSFETNLEKILLKHRFNKSMVQNVNEVFPIIKTAMIFLNMSGADLNTKFKGDIDYLINYIKASVKNESIVEPKHRELKSIADQIKYVTSALALGFSPVSGLYQTIQGLWLDISLMIRKPDGSESFKFTHFRLALTNVYKDAFYFGNKPTLTEALNFEYAMNDMDINVYADRIATPKRGLFNLENFLFRFSSRPDYYNRMGILTAQMIKDGSYEAHSVDEDGRLIYDWTKDKRFELFAKNPTSNSKDPEFNKQKALYITMMLQFIKEGYKGPDGEYLKLDMNNPLPIPRAYTNLQIEDKKSLSDTIYGYYSHEKKSLLHATLVGSLFMQFRTYWSGKKNQYFGPGGVKLRGSFLDVEGLYYQINEDGSISDELTTENTGVPALLWKGEWQEGILVSLTKTISITNPGKTKENFMKNWYHEDELIRNAYRHNIKLAGFDTLMAFLVGPLFAALLAGWLDELKDESDKDDLGDAAKVTAATVLTRSINNSFLDFNYLASIFNPAIDWLPFSISWSVGTVKRLTDAAMGNSDLYDAMVKSASVTKTAKPIFDVIKPDFFNDKEK